MLKPCPNLPRPLRLALALSQAALLSLMSLPGQGAVTVSGPYFSNPGGAVLPPSAPNLSLPGTELWLAAGAAGSFAADAGSQVELGSFYLGMGGTGTASLSGAGTTLRLNSNGNLLRLTVGVTSLGTLTVSDGALLDGRYQAANCLLGIRSCGSMIGDAAGASGTLAVTGAGSQALLLGTLLLGNAAVFDGYGTAGATSTGILRVEQGGELRSQGLHTGVGWSPRANGLEQSVARVTVSGSSSRLIVETNTLNGNEAVANFASGDARSAANLWVIEGGRFEVASEAGRNYGLRLGNGGSFAGEVSGAGSLLTLGGDADKGYFHIGEGGQAGFLVGSGGRLEGGQWNQIGLNGGDGTLHVLGLGSQAVFARGSLTVGNAAAGGLLVGLGGSLQARQLNVGSSQAGRPERGMGSVTLEGVGSVITLDNPDGHRLALGDWGGGGLLVRDGALLDGMSANAAVCAGRWCGSLIGHAAGSDASLVVTGAGSEARLLGQMVVGGTQRNAIASDGWDFGSPNGVTHARIEVLAGGSLVNEWVDLGGWQPRAVHLNEQSFADVVVSGAGSTWSIRGSALGGNDAVLAMGTQQRSTTTLTVSQGGLVQLQAPDARSAGLYLSTGQGKSHVTLSDSGTRLELKGVNANVSVGASGGGSATLIVKDGALLTQEGSSWSQLTVGEIHSQGAMEILGGGQVSGARSVNIGSGGTGSLLIDGAGSLLSTERSGSFVGQLNVGPSGSGMLTVRNGGQASAFALQIGNGYGADRGEVLLEGVGSRIEADALDWHRLAISNGKLTVAGGAVFDATLNAAACTGRWCGSFLANNAGDDATFTITGAGSRASFLSGFNVGQSYVTAPPDTPWSLGRPGQTSRVLLNVRDGGRLETEGGRIAQGPSGGAATGAEGVQALVRVSGAGSVWDVRGGPDDGGVASIIVGYGSGVAANTQTDIQILDGGRIHLHADPAHAAQLNLGLHGGLHSLRISGAGSTLSYADTGNAGMWIGRNGAMASVALSEGGQIQGINRLQVGNTGAIGRLSVLGAASGIVYGDYFADLYVGRQGGYGSVEVGGGAQVLMHARQFSRLFVGENTGASVAAGSGSLNLSGAGTLLSMRSGLDGEAGSFNPYVVVGRSASGDLRVGNGAVLRIEGLAPAGPETYFEGAGLIVGHGWDGPSAGRVDVSGVGSRLDTLGTNPFITVGDGAKGSGHLSISAGAEVRTTLMGIADFGASGSTQIDNATLLLSGAWRSGVTIGASLAVGNGSGSMGTLSLINGGRLIVENPAGDTPTNLSLGGLAGFLPGGSGLMNLSGGSRVEVGMDDSHGQLLIGATAGGIGVATLDGASRIDTDYLGVGAFYGADAGVGTLIVNGESRGQCGRASRSAPRALSVVPAPWSAASSTAACSVLAVRRAA